MTQEQVDYVLGQGDTEPVIREVLTDRQGNPLDLTDAVSVTFRGKHQTRSLEIGGEAKIVAPMVVNGVPQGKVAYSPTSVDSAVAGTYNVQWVVLEPAPVQQPPLPPVQRTIPPDHYKQLQILPAL